MKKPLFFVACLAAIFLFYLAAVADEAQLHPWWQVTEAEAHTFFQRGKEIRQSGEKDYKKKYFQQAFFDKSISGFINVKRAVILPPKDFSEFTGFMAENDLLSEEASEQRFIDAFKLVDKIALFVVEAKAGLKSHGAYKTNDSMQGLYLVKFALETDTGKRIQSLPVARPAISTELKSQIFSAKGQFLAKYSVQFPCLDSDGKPAITENTRWVKLWVISDQKRIPITFWLDEKKKVEVGEAE